MVDLILKTGILFLAGWFLVSCESFDGDFGGPLDEASEVMPSKADPVVVKEAPTTDSLELPTFEDPGGDLDLKALTRLALANSPVFAEAEGNLKVAKAQRQTIGQWRDPEIRNAFNWDDVRVGNVKEPGNDDQVRRQESFATRLRFYPPNPFEIRAELDKSMAEITYGEFFFKQAGREVVQQVRRLYQELQFLQENIRMGRGQYRAEHEEYERMRKLLDAGQLLRGPVDKQRIVYVSKQGNTSSQDIRYQKVRAELAALVGLGNASRISVQGVPNRPLIGFRGDSASSLAEMAFINNLKLGDLDRLQSLAKGDLKAFNAKKIPWISFIEGGRDRAFRDHLPVSDRWSVRLALTVPIFSLFSKEGAVYKEQIRSYQKQAERYRQQIERRVESAVANIRDSRDGLSRYDRETSKIISELREIEGEVAEFPNQLADLVHRRRTTGLSRSRDRLAAEQAYHDAILDLEDLIRDDVESVFRNAAQ